MSKLSDPDSFLSLCASAPLSHTFKSTRNMDSQSQTRHCLLPAGMFLYTQHACNATRSVLYRRATSACPSHWSSRSPGKGSPSPFPGFPQEAPQKMTAVDQSKGKRSTPTPEEKERQTGDRQQPSDVTVACQVASWRDKLPSLEQVFWVCFFGVGTLFREDPDNRTEAAVYLFQPRPHLKFSKLPLAH